MARPALDWARSTAGALTLAAMLLLTAAGGAAAGGDDRSDEELREAQSLGTRPVRLDRAAVEKAAAALGITGDAKRTTLGWEAEDELRELYLTRTPSAWYVHFTDSSSLLGPAGDRDAICAAPDAPYGCTVPDVEFVADVGGTAPDAETAAAAAEDLLESSGLLPGEWDVLVLEPSRDALPCNDELVTPFPCTRQVVPTRAVMLTRELGDAPAARWGVIVGPRGQVLSAVGRVAVAR